MSKQLEFEQKKIAIIDVQETRQFISGGVPLLRIGMKRVEVKEIIGERFEEKTGNVQIGRHELNFSANDKTLYNIYHKKYGDGYRNPYCLCSKKNELTRQTKKLIIQ